MQVFSISSDSKMKNRLYHDASQTIVHLSLKENQQVPEHHGGDAIVTVIPVKGEIIFSSGDQAEHLVPGKLVRLNSKELHSLKAVKDSDVIVVKWQTADKETENTHTCH
ncbi:hypothetical protein EWI07_09685 [Sporolactobacillus sp. THM7-4]|nr:hypothetical protein EWI07_09685 [Sporolactobacillus sp. THM7-4]